MKAIYHIKASLLTLAAMVACTEMEINNESQDSTNNGLLQELSITGKDFQFEDATRSSVTIGESGASFTWDEDDVIGIFPDKGDQVSFAMDKGAGTQTATFSGGGWALKSSSKYAAYYPHVYENRDLTKIPVSYVGQTQNGNANTDHIGAYDFMAASVTTPENGAVAFDMQHLGALVQLTITVPEPSTLTKVVLTSSTEFTETGTIDLTATTPAITADKQSTTLEIALNDVATIEANEKVIVYFMTAPVDLTDSELTAKIYFTDATTCEGELTGSNLQSGMAYRFSTEVDRPDSQPNDYIDEYGVNRGEGIEIDGVVWAPVNCGYHTTDYPYGKLYQWGRKYGQGYDSEDAEYPSGDKIISGPVTNDIGQAESNKGVFYYSSASPYDWVTTRDNTLWNSGSESTPTKSNYDPCPQGWRVPTHSELVALSKNRSEWTTNTHNQNGFWLSGYKTYCESVPQVFLPAAGSRGFDDGIKYSRATGGRYWSSGTIDSNAYDLNFGNTYCQIGKHGRANGYSIRCVHE